MTSLVVSRRLTKVGLAIVESQRRVSVSSLLMIDSMIFIFPSACAASRYLRPKTIASGAIISKVKRLMAVVELISKESLIIKTMVRITARKAAWSGS